jgi:hypothetical protein
MELAKGFIPSKVLKSIKEKIWADEIYEMLKTLRIEAYNVQKINE